MFNCDTIIHVTISPLCEKEFTRVILDQRAVKWLFVLVVVHSTVEKSSDNLPSYPSDNHAAQMLSIGGNGKIGKMVVCIVQASIGQRSFAVNGPHTWNSLPAALRSPDLSLRSFKRQLEVLPVPSLRVSGS